jgi:two-component system, OmpR family, sensor kinase
MARWRMRISPLRLWLQSTSLLAVLAGYSLLLLFNHQLAGLQRQAAHRQLVEQLATELSGRARSREQLQPLLDAALLPGLRLQLLQPWGPAPQSRAAGQAWLVSRLPLALADGSRATLLVEQNVTASVQQERLGFWLLVVATGVASLFTSGLLRLVLRRGLVQPLEEFTAQLRATQAPPAPDDTIDVAAQPEELQPIAQAFNDLQQRLRSSWERQRAFVDGVAHELRTPITLISGHTQSLLRGTPSAASLRLIQEEAVRMASLVSDLLDLARQDSGRLSLRRRSIVGDDALLGLYERMAAKAAGRLRLDPGDPNAPEPPIGMGDPDRLQQCLTTLVDNALQYSPAPQPVTLACGTGPAGELVLHVRDQGPGVAADEREAIFGRFVRGSAAIRSDSRGSGIGLSMVKLLIEAMGGRVRVADVPGGGADFQLLLPPVGSLVASASEPAQGANRNHN